MKKLNILGALVLGLVTLCGCSQQPSKIRVGDLRKMTDRLTYIKDDRTNLCFAAVASRHIADTDQSGFTITWVPCSPEVIKELGK